MGRRIIGELLRISIAGLIVMMFVRSFLCVGVIPICRITSDSMTPTLAPGARIFADRAAFYWRHPRRFEIVLFRCPHNPQEFCVKRIVGLPGEKLQIRGGNLYIDGVHVATPTTAAYQPKPGQEFGNSPEYTLADGQYFVLGDNGHSSADSRVWNPFWIPLDAIIGRVISTANHVSSHDNPGHDI